MRREVRATAGFRGLALRVALPATLLAALAGGAAGQGGRDDPAPPPAPRDPAVPAPAPGEPPAPDAAPVTAFVRRLSDVVAVREAPGARERVLYYFAPTAELLEGGHVEQGSGGHSEIDLPEGGRAVLHATGHAILDRLAPEGDRLRFPLVTRLELIAGPRPIEALLPGGARCVLLETALFVFHEPGRLRLRNEGGRPVQVHAGLRLDRAAGGAEPPSSVEILRGEEIVLPLVGAAVGGDGLQAAQWNGRLVVHGADVLLDPRDGALGLRRAGEAAGAGGELSVGGVRTRVGAVPIVIEDPQAPPEGGREH